MLRKEIKKWGNSAVLILTKEDLKVGKLKIGDAVDLKINKKGRKKNEEM